MILKRTRLCIDVLRAVPQYWFARLYVSLSIFLTTATVLFGRSGEPPNAWHEHMDPTSAGFVWLLMLLSVVTVVDVAINDMMPGRYCFNRAKNNRHLLFIAMAIVETAVLTISVGSGSFQVYHLRLALQIAGASALACFDLVARHSWHD